MRNDDLCGLRGWLVLVGIGVVVSPFKLAASTLPVFIPLFRDGTWRYLVTPGSSAYSPFWMPLLAGEITFNLAMFCCLLATIYLFFSKHRLFPKFYIGIALASIAVLPLDAWLVSLILKQPMHVDEATAADLGRTVITAAIWIPYMLKSQRVKATFVRGNPAAETPPEARDQPDENNLPADDADSYSIGSQPPPSAL